MSGNVRQIQLEIAKSVENLMALGAVEKLVTGEHVYEQPNRDAENHETADGNDGV